MASRAQSLRDSISGPSRDAVAVAPSDLVNIPGGPTTALYVGTGGDMTVITRDGTQTQFKAVPAGMLLPIQVVRVMSTGLGASNIVALF